MKGQEINLSNLYIVKLNRTLFEVLEAESKPRKLVSKLTRTVEAERVQVSEDPNTGALVVKKVKYPKKHVMQQVSFQGGRVRGVIPYNYRLFSELKLHVPADTLIKLTRTQANRLLEALE